VRRRTLLLFNIFFYLLNRLNRNEYERRVSVIPETETRKKSTSSIKVRRSDKINNKKIYREQ